MKIIRPNEPFPQLTKSVVSVGNFDGVHNGHQILARHVVERAKYHGASSVLITFEPHTRDFFNPEQKTPRLTTFEEKILCMEPLGIDYLICLAFDTTLATMSPDSFIENFLIKQFHAVEWVMGENHTFGKNRQGDHYFLHNSHVRNHFNVFIVRLHGDETKTISSTIIRSFIDESRLDDAVDILGHPYPIVAKRIRGMRKGTSLGYPTLNFRCPPSQKVIPPPGVYAAEIAYLGQVLYGALYYGNCPTFDNREYHFEFHSLAPLTFEPEVESEIALWLHSFIRPDQSFSTEEQLVQQIENDIKHIQQFFKKE